jgi:DNA-binding GntR family transcriptional regulator
MTVPAEPALDQTARAYEQVRQAILDGTLAPGATFSQVQLAAQLDVSRTPLREALRRLETERLVEAVYNRRVRVSPVSLDDLEQLYAMRISLESLGVRATVPELGDDELAVLRQALVELDAAPRDDFRTPHRRFHVTLVSGAGDRLRGQIEDLWDHAERYRLAYMSPDEHGALRELARSEHEAIMAAASAHDADACSRLTASHLARTALTVIARMDGGYDPRLIRAAVQHVGSAARR